MAWTTPATAVTNTVITASFFNTNLRDNLVYLNSNEWLKISSITGVDPITFSSITGVFSHLKFAGLLRSTSAATQKDLNITLNALASYNTTTLDIDGAATNVGTNNVAQATAIVKNAVCGSTAPASTYSEIELLIPNYSIATFYKSLMGKISRRVNTAATSDIHSIDFVAWDASTAAITQVSFAASVLNTNSVITMYGAY